MRCALFSVACLVVVAGQVPDPSGPPPLVKPEDKCTIEGSVVNLITGEAVKKVNIVLRSLGSGGNRAHTAISDGSGRFKVEDLDPGRYVMTAARTGYAQQQYTARGPARPGEFLTLTAGQNLKDLVFKLTPHGVVIGRVVDEDGDPLAQVMLQCQRYAYNNGKKQLLPAGNGITNDLGEYRIFGLPPGRYYLSAQYQNQGVPPPTDPKKDHEEAYATVYYPNSPTPEGAAPLEITAGAQLRGIDLALTKTRAVRIRGRLIGATDKIRGMVSLTLRNSSSMYSMSRYNTQVMNNQGSFEIHNVVPGSYFLVGQVYEQDKQSTTRVPIEVGTSNMDGIQVTVTPAQDITGHLTVENNADTGGASFTVYMPSKYPGPYGGSGEGVVNTDGTFTLHNIMRDSYTIGVAGVRDNQYVKSIRFGDADVTDSGIDFTQGVTQGELTILVSTAGGQIDGTVQNEKSEPAIGATVVLIPSPEKRDRPMLYKRATTDQTGKFSIKGIVPGEYKVFAWEQVEFGAYQDPDFLKPYESKGESVSIKESAHETKQLNVIAATQP